MFTTAPSRLLKNGRRGPLPHGHGSVRHSLLLRWNEKAGPLRDAICSRMDALELQKENRP
jgi:hypothetical protein